MTGFVDFLSGALACTFAIAAVFFLKFWRRTHDRLFLSFAVAFVLFAINQSVEDRIDVMNERRDLIYLLRVTGFLVILFAIVRKNTKRRSG
jgi:hypothetical protein